MVSIQAELYLLHLQGCWTTTTPSWLDAQNAPLGPNGLCIQRECWGCLPRLTKGMGNQPRWWFPSRDLQLGRRLLYLPRHNIHNTVHGAMVWYEAVYDTWFGRTLGQRPWARSPEFTQVLHNWCLQHVDLPWGQICWAVYFARNPC